MYRWDFDGLARQQFENLSPAAGLVTFLVYPPDDLVLVVRLQWLGD